MKKLFVTIGMTLMMLVLNSGNLVYADIVVDREKEIIKYTTGYWIAIICGVVLVVSISIYLLRKIYKKNQETEKNLKTEEGAEK